MRFTGGPFNGATARKPIPWAMFNVPGAAGWYELTGQEYVWHEWLGVTPTNISTPMARPRPTAAEQRRRDREKAARTAREKADFERIDKLVIWHEAHRPQREPTPPLLWDGIDTKTEAHIHVDLPPLDIVGWLLDQTEPLSSR